MAVSASAQLSPPPPPPPPPPAAAPTFVYPEPNLYLLLRLPGDRVAVRYTPGALDRAANLQSRLEAVSRLFTRWANREATLRGFVLSREEWTQAGLDAVPYGLPVRAGRYGLAAPAVGDDGIVALWRRLLDGHLPNVAGTPLFGSPEEAACLIASDVLAQVLVGETLAEGVGIAGDQHWVRGLMAHVVSDAVSRKIEPGRAVELGPFFDLLAAGRKGPALAASDYRPEISLEDWLWFQARFYVGARLLVADEGKGDVVKKMMKIARRSEGTLRADELLHEYKKLGEWYRETFTAVSSRTDG